MYPIAVSTHPDAFRNLCPSENLLKGKRRDLVESGNACS